MAIFKDITNQTFERLYVLAYAGKKSHGASIWLCHCACGNFKRVRGDSLWTGKTKSCSCLQIDIVTRHGQARRTMGWSSTYRSWQAMKRRCLNPKVRGYKNYGGRGITICERWLESFENFLADMGPRPPGMSLDRIDPNGNYEPGNCRWATAKEQSLNKRSSNRSIPLNAKI